MRRVIRQLIFIPFIPLIWLIGFPLLYLLTDDPIRIIYKACLQASKLTVLGDEI